MEDEKLLELSDPEVHINFQLHHKCRANVRLTSLHPTSPIAFKVQTSSPHKFLVNPPNGLIPPLSCATFQIILKPQPHPPPSFPRNPTDRFLIKSAKFSGSPDSTRPEFVHSWFNSRAHLATHDLKLRVAYVGSFLFREAIGRGDVDAVRNIVRREKGVVAELTVSELESLSRLGKNSEKLASLLREAGLEEINAREDDDDDVDKKGDVDSGVEPMGCELDKENVGCAETNNKVADVGVDINSNSTHNLVMKQSEQGEMVLTAARKGEPEKLRQLLKSGANANHTDQYGLTALHAAAIKGHKDVVGLLIEFGMSVECVDKEGHTALHLAVEGGDFETVELLVSRGANVNVRSVTGATPLYMAQAMGYDDLAKFLMNRGAIADAIRAASVLSLRV